MSELRKTVFHSRHIALGAKMVEFAGWDMPLQYSSGILQEHLTTRKHSGLFDVSHMGRFAFRGSESLAFLQRVLTNNAAALDVGQAQYTILPNAGGGAVDDAYLYRFTGDQYLLVVNASNREKDWGHFQSILPSFSEVQLSDESETMAMLSLQGACCEQILADLVESPCLPAPKRNMLGAVVVRGVPVKVSRTGYTGEPLAFELFMAREHALTVWDALLERGASPVGLGARDTLRLEAALPLYGHELGTDVEGNDIPVYACPLAKFAVNFSPLKGDFIGKSELQRQYNASMRIISGDCSEIDDLPRVIMPLMLIDKGVARHGMKVFNKERKAVGYVTSGTMVPYWKSKGVGVESVLTDEQGMRAICLALVDSDIREGDSVAVEIRGRAVSAVVVPRHLSRQSPPYARAVLPATTTL